MSTLSVKGTCLQPPVGDHRGYLSLNSSRRVDVHGQTLHRQRYSKNGHQKLVPQCVDVLLSSMNLDLFLPWNRNQWITAHHSGEHGCDSWLKECLLSLYTLTRQTRSEGKIWQVGQTWDDSVPIAVSPVLQMADERNLCIPVTRTAYVKVPKAVFHWKQ